MDAVSFTSSSSRAGRAWPERAGRRQSADGGLAHAIQALAMQKRRKISVNSFNKLRQCRPALPTHQGHDIADLPHVSPVGPTSNFALPGRSTMIQ
jgi:hypothetical protein